MSNEIQTIATPSGLRMEVLQPEVSHEIRQTTLDELKKWIEEGKLLPNHQVRIKNLSWLKAIDLQTLKPAFETAKQAVIAKKEADAKKSQPEKAFIAPMAPVVKPIVENKAIPTEASVPFKLYEEKVLGKSKSNDSQTDETNNQELKIADSKAKQSEKKVVKPMQLKAQKGNSTSVLKSIGGFVGGCVLVLMLAYSGSYLWVYLLRGTPKVDENRIGELAVLEQKLYNEKVNLRLSSGNSNQQIDINAEFAKLDKKLAEDRKPIIENHLQNLLQNDFNNLFYFSFGILLIVFLIFRILMGKRQQVVVNNSYSALHETEITNPIQIAKSESEKVEKDIHQTAQSQVETTHSPNIHQTNSSPNIANLDELMKNPEYKSLLEAENIKFCLLHRDKTSEFMCDGCNNNFCAECPSVNGEIANCCPFCRIPCKAVESVKTKVIFVNVGDGKEPPKPKKEFNLVVKVEEEKRSYKVGIISAFLISMCFSVSIAYFWVYEISPRLEPQTEEVAQKVTQEKPKENPEKKVAYDLKPQTNSNGAPIQRKCVDPESRETFDCDEEIYRALYDQTAKTESVESAQKNVEEKTKLILNPLLPQDEKDKDKTEEKTNQLTPEQQTKIENDRSKFYRIWLISFFVMFGGLLSVGFLFKDKSDVVNQDEEVIEE